MIELTEKEGNQRCYTPLSIAKRMFELLPLERIPPDDRVIYDPAAGSGSLLIAATQRLSNMDDISSLSEKGNILSSNVLGNDKDNNAHFSTKVRYSLAQKTFGISAPLFPEPNYYGRHDYNSEAAWSNLPKRPHVIVANPPFKEVGSKNLAAEFVSMAINRLGTGDMFAFVLPIDFLIGTADSWKETRGLITEKCNILESWQLPEGVVGLSARQPVSIVLGDVGTPAKNYTISRSIFSSAKAVTDSSRLRGFLGSSKIERHEELNLQANQFYGSPNMPGPVDYVKASQTWEDEQSKPCLLSSGQVMGVDYETGKVCLHLNNLDDEVDEAWITLPQNLPAWALDGTVFNVDIPEDVILFEDLNKRPWALQNFRHTPRPYLSFEDLQNRLLKVSVHNLDSNPLQRYDYGTGDIIEFEEPIKAKPKSPIANQKQAKTTDIFLILPKNRKD